jgi:hypothetical protein
MCSDKLLRTSVEFPTRNLITLLEICLHRFISMDMTAKELEIIVLDDGSTGEASAHVLSTAQQSLHSTLSTKYLTLQ